MAAPELPTASLMIVGTGWPERRANRSAWLGRTKTSGMRKTKPMMVLSATVPTKALGTWVAGYCTSSHILYLSQHLDNSLV